MHGKFLLVPLMNREELAQQLAAAGHDSVPLLNVTKSLKRKTAP
jgi:hypothetical protein